MRLERTNEDDCTPKLFACSIIMVRAMPLRCVPSAMLLMKTQKVSAGEAHSNRAKTNFRAKNPFPVALVPSSTTAAGPQAASAVRGRSGHKNNARMRQKFLFFGMSRSSKSLLYAMPVAQRGSEGSTMRMHVARRFCVWPHEQQFVCGGSGSSSNKEVRRGDDDDE